MHSYVAQSISLTLSCALWAQSSKIMNQYENCVFHFRNILQCFSFTPFNCKRWDFLASLVLSCCFCYFFVAQGLSFGRRASSAFVALPKINGVSVKGCNKMSQACYNSCFVSFTVSRFLSIHIGRIVYLYICMCTKHINIYVHVHVRAYFCEQ